MPSGLFRLLGAVKRSDVSSGSSGSTTTLPQGTEHVGAERPQIDRPHPLSAGNQPHPLFKKVQQTWDYHYGHWSETQRAQKLNSTRSTPSNTKIIAYNRIDPLGKNNDHVWVEFRSQPLIEIIRSEFRDITDLYGSSPGLDARLLYNKRQGLAACVDNTPSIEVNLQPNGNPEVDPPDAEDLKALRLLLDFIESEFANITTQVDELRNEGRITWDLLWTLCEKGTLLLQSPNDSPPFAFELIRWAYGAKERSSSVGLFSSSDATEKPAQFTAYGRSVRWTGRKFKETRVELKVDHFLGTRALSALPFRPSSESLREKLLARGKIYVNLAGICYMQYESDQGTSRVMIDVAECDAARNNDDMMMLMSRSRSNHSDTGAECFVGLTSQEIISEDHPDLRLLPAGLDGWNFRTKSWGCFLVENLSSIEFNDDAFEHLVLQEKYKRLVLAFVNAHTREAQKNQPIISDTVKGKGGGMVMLLHGNPGTGKTLTAEAVADHLQRPLYSVSSGELGLVASKLESQLNLTLKRAAGWDCVVLIDEADIFLQARNNDIERSALVSVFLRVLEYHNGVLILTTNRVNIFDKAFQSRIGVALKYPDLDQSSRKILWTKFLTMAAVIKAENKTMWEEEVDKLSLRVMNGRDIKNAVRGAQALAYQEKVPFNLSHLGIVLSIADEFSEALKSGELESSRVGS